MSSEQVSSYKQDGRLLAIDTELGQDQILLTRLEGEDAISRVFTCVIEIATRLPAERIRKLLAKPVTLWIGSQSAPVRRPVHGFVRQLTQLDQDVRGLQIWQAEVVPKLWFLTCTADCRIFQALSVPDIISKVLGEHDVVHHEIRGLMGEYPKLDYCVQYRESSFAFLSRLMEHVGISYWHEHFPDKHVLVMSDCNQVLKPALTEQVTRSDRPDLGDIQKFEQDYVFRPGKHTMTDYDFEAPAKQLSVNMPTMLDVPRMASHEVYDYPGGFSEKSLGAFLARRRIEQDEMQHHRIRGSASTAGFDAGRRITVVPERGGADGAKYILTGVRHHATDLTYLTGAPTALPTYSNSFTAIPLDVPFRPERTTPKPVVRGPQTATVTGPAGEEIFTDKHGRVKVRFHWDRNPDSNKDENSSCWVRVSQAWAGSGWGGVNIPHVGHEVVVSFLEGDPDRPLVTGRVYNGKNAKSMALPANKTQSAMRDHSGNEIVMEGKKGSQDVRVTAVKDMTTTVHNNRTTHVMVDDALDVDAKRTIHTKGKLTETTDAGQEVTVSSGYKETITGGAESTITGGLVSTVNGKWDSTVNGHFKELVSSGEERDVTGGKTLTVTGPIKQSAGATTDIHASGAGTYTSEASLKFAVAGSVIEITASSITISTGPSTVKLDASGVAVTGPKISLNG